MSGRRFSLVGKVDTESPAAVGRALQKMLPRGSVAPGSSPGEFVVRAEMHGESAKELNRSLLSDLRRVEKKTRLRAEWTSDDGEVNRFFDYVLKKTLRV
jgi:hypothetical protein